MKTHNLIRRIILTAMLICFFAVPQKILAGDLNLWSGDGYQILSEFESKKIIDNFPDGLLKKWRSLMADGYSDPREKTVVCLLKELTTLDLWNYYFRDLPVDVSLAVVKQSIEISKLIGTEDVSGIIGKIEKETAKAAVNYLEEYFSKSQTKVSFGAMEVKYNAETGSVDSSFQYIIMYQPINEEKGTVVARIYSPKEITPPPSRGSLGLSKGFLNSLAPGQNIPPFIIEIKGEMKKGMYGSYFWNGNPEIKAVFPEAVPDFGLKPRTWQEKYIVNPIKKGLSDILSLGKIFGFQTEAVDYLLKEEDTEKISREVENMEDGGDIEEKYPEAEVGEIKIIKQDSVEEKKLGEDEAKEEKQEEKKAEEKKEEKPVFKSCSKDIPYVPGHNIIFNEIAWMGSKASANDEWMELKNVSGEDINLKGYTVSDKGEQIKVVFDDFVLPSGGFVLLERTDDSSVPFKAADMIYQGSLSNKDEGLYLFDPSCVAEDYVLANPEWPAGSNSEKRTMEREADFVWMTYSEGEKDGILGTPREPNSPGKIIKESKKEINSNSISLAASDVGGPSSDVSQSYCLQSNLLSPDHRIIINEVAWMGSETSSSDEWIELKNSSDSAVSLDGWQLLDKSNQIKVVFSSSDIINPGGYYLLERTNDDSVPGIVADKIYSGALSDTDESLRLFAQECVLVDEVLANPEWPAGSKNSKKTMERGDDLEWHTCSSDIDSASGLWGTPKAANSPAAEEEPDDNPVLPEEDVPSSDIPLLITEVQTNGEGGYEYIELFNQSDEEIELCSDDSCYYLSYYSPGSSWSDPYRNWKFPEGESVFPGSYYLIDVFGNSRADWRLETAEETEAEHYYETGQLGNESGSLAVFSGNPKYDGEEEKTPEELESRAISLRIDALGWGDGVIVKEGLQFSDVKSGKVIGRSWTAGEYIDTDNNSEDFRAEKASPRDHAPKPPQKVENLAASFGPEKNSIILSWPSAVDEDTPRNEIGYEIYYSRNGQIDESNLKNINDYVSIEIVRSEDGLVTAEIPDLYYDSKYSFAVMAKDPQDNFSLLSDAASSETGKAVHQKPSPYHDFRRSNRSVFAGPTNGNMSEAVVFAQGVDANMNNDNLSSGLVIDDNGTVYFFGNIDGAYGIFAYNSDGRKWVYSGEGFNEPSLGKDGSIYFSDSQSVYSLSPSGKLASKQDFEKVYTKNIAIDSGGMIYFVASERSGNAVLFASDGEEKMTVSPIGELGTVYSELVIDEKDSIYFSKDNAVLKFDRTGKVAEKVFEVEYSSDHPERDKADRAEQVYVAFDGTILVNVFHGWCCYNINSQLDVFYALDNDLEEVLWSNREYGSVIGIGDGEFYMLMRRPGFWENMAVSLADGSIKWTKGPFYPQSSMVVSDSGSNIYFTQNFSVIGYDSGEIKDGIVSNDRILSFSGAEQYCYSPPSIGDGVMYISKFKEILAVRY